MQCYYYDETGRKYGPFSVELMKKLVDNGTIHTQTTIETDTGKKFRAVESPTLFPVAKVPEPETIPIPQPPPSVPQKQNNLQPDDEQLLALQKEFSRAYLFSDVLNSLMIAVAFISFLAFIGIASEASGLFATITVLPATIILCVTFAIVSRIIRSQAMSAKLLYLIYERLLDD